jgi:hypothetical protein
MGRFDWSFILKNYLTKMYILIVGSGRFKENHERKVGQNVREKQNYTSVHSRPSPCTISVIFYVKGALKP